MLHPLSPAHCLLSSFRHLVAATADWYCHMLIKDCSASAPLWTCCCTYVNRLNLGNFQLWRPRAASLAALQRYQLLQALTVMWTQQLQADPSAQAVRSQTDPSRPHPQVRCLRCPPSTCPLFEPDLYSWSMYKIRSRQFVQRESRWCSLPVALDSTGESGWTLLSFVWVQQYPVHASLHLAIRLPLLVPE